MKIHLGNGSIYLRPNIDEDGKNGWLNVDLESPRQHLVKDKPHMIADLSATDDDYYARKRHVTFGENAVYDPEGVSDAYGSFLHIPCADGGCTEILARQVFEHLSMHEAQLAMIECARALCSGGILRLDVPDIETTLAKYRETGDDFFRRHVLGSRRNAFAYHLAGWTREGLEAMATRAGFDLAGEEPNIHIYPAFCLRFRKVGAGRPAWSYALGPIEIQKAWKCLDAGCGANPWPRANVLLDAYDTHKGLARVDQTFVVGDVTHDIPFPDKHFDFALCSHVLEHVSHPDLAAKELTRVAKAGLIVCPSIAKEALTGWCDAGHEWEVLRPLRQGEPLRFRRANKDWRNAHRREEMTAAMWRLMIAGYSGGEDGATLRRWFSEHEFALDIVYPWEKELKVVVEE